MDVKIGDVIKVCTLSSSTDAIDYEIIDDAILDPETICYIDYFLGVNGFGELRIIFINEKRNFLSTFNGTLESSHEPRE